MLTITDAELAAYAYTPTGLGTPRSTVTWKLEDAVKNGSLLRWLGAGLYYILDMEGRILVGPKEVKYTATVEEALVLIEAWKVRVIKTIEDSYEDGLDTDQQRQMDAWLQTSLFRVWWMLTDAIEAGQDALQDDALQFATGCHREANYVAKAVQKNWEKALDKLVAEQG